MRSFPFLMLLGALALAAPASAFTAGDKTELASPNATGSSTQPPDERASQDTLPKSTDPMWDRFGKCKVTLDQATYMYSINLTPDVQALAGKLVTVTGFMLPLDADEEFTHFLLSKRTPTCPFCPPGEPNEIVEVFAAKKLKWDENLMTVSGTLTLTNDAEKGLFFQMMNAESVASQPVTGAQNMAKPPI